MRRSLGRAGGETWGMAAGSRKWRHSWWDVSSLQLSVRQVGHFAFLGEHVCVSLLVVVDKSWLTCAIRPNSSAQGDLTCMNRSALPQLCGAPVPAR